LEAAVGEEEADEEPAFVLVPVVSVCGLVVFRVARIDLSILFLH